MRRFFWIRLRMFLRRCAGGGIVMAAWFAFGTAAFHAIDGLPLPRALAVALYVGYTPSPLWELYSFWGQCVLFGIVICIVSCYMALTVQGGPEGVARNTMVSVVSSLVTVIVMDSLVTALYQNFL